MRKNNIKKQIKAIWHILSGALDVSFWIIKIAMGLSYFLIIVLCLWIFIWVKQEKNIHIFRQDLTEYTKEHTVESIPNVRLKAPGNYVSNPDKILYEEDVICINRLLKEFEEETSIEIAVVAVESIGSKDARVFATELFNYWGIGKKEDDNGLLIQLITEPVQRSVVFETGYGLEGYLPDIICYYIQQDFMLPDMREGDYSTGMVKGIKAVIQYLETGDYSRPFRPDESYSHKDEGDSGWWPLLIFFGIFGTFIVFFILLVNSQTRPQICPSCGKKEYRYKRLDVTQKATRYATGIGYEVHECQACGYTTRNQTTLHWSDSSDHSSGDRSGGSSSGGGSWGGGRSGGGGSISRF